MRFHKIKALLYRDFLTLSKSKQRIIESLFFPLTSTLIWGLFANYFKQFSVETAMMLLIINVFWSFSYLSQSAANLQINMDVWSRSLYQLLVSGIHELEYIIARILYSVISSLIILGSMLYITHLFGFQLPALLPLLYLIAATLLASTSLCILIVALFVLLGREYAFLSWSFLQLIILLSAPFFPIKTYPVWMQKVAYVLPHTWIFETLKRLPTEGALNINLINRSLIISMAVLCIVLPFYIYVFKKSKKSGQLVRLST
ncbi:MAG: hypothetical protein MAG795_00810 [Candidatus Woesearchaeota archaeon]|nr:hypothetical protein [Candidatus Woesearchaeota archaeon]